MSVAFQSDAFQIDAFQQEVLAEYLAVIIAVTGLTMYFINKSTESSHVLIDKTPAFVLFEAPQ